MGTLYLAQDPRLKRPVAIKLLRDDYAHDPDVRARFLREAQSAASLKHPNIIVVHDVDEHDGRPFIAMEYIAGETLTALILRRPPVPLTRRLAIGEEVCAGLFHAHRNGIVHRDIKPSNVMLDADGVVKILDFGIARLGNSGMTQDGQMMGTLNYMSPEQIAGRGVDHRTDIFATGALLYELVTLRQVFPGGIDSGVLNRILHEGAPLMRDVLPDLDPELDRIVQRALARDIAKRYQDANLLRRDLAHVRRRLEQEGHGGAAASPRDDTIVARPGTTPAGGSRKPLPSARFVELRRQQVEEHLKSSRDALEKRDYQLALEQAERAAMIDSESTLAFELIERARFGVEVAAIKEHLAQASASLAEGRLDEADSLVDQASAMTPDVEEAADIRREIQATAGEIAAARERERRIDSSLQRARTSLSQGGYETALRAVYEVLAIDPNRAEAIDLERVTKSRLQEQREHEQARRDAYNAIKRARALADERRFDEALEALGGLEASSETVRVASLAAREDIQRRMRQAELDRAVDEARTALDDGHVESAIAMIDAIAAPDRTPDAWSIRTRAVEALRQREEVEQKRRLLDAAMAAFQQMLDSGNLGGARTHLDEAVRIGLAQERIAEGRAQIDAAEAAAEARRRQEIRDRSARERVEAARQWFAKGEAHVAVALLERDGRSHPLIDAALAEMRAAIAEQDERARLEAERRRQEDEARRQAEIEAGKRRREAAEHAARVRVEAARELFAKGEPDAAIASLEGDKRGHPMVEAALAEMRTAVAEQQRLARAEAERRQRDEDARRRAQAEAAKAREAEQRARDAEERARRDAAERARREADEAARLEAEARAREQEERARREAEERARREAEERARHEAEQRARQEAEQRARQEADRRARQEAEEHARQEAAERARRQAAERARREAEERARREAEAARLEAEARARREEEERATAEASATFPAEAPATEFYPPVVPRPRPVPVRRVWVGIVLAAAAAIGVSIWQFSRPETAVQSPPPVRPLPPGPSANPSEIVSLAESQYEQGQIVRAIGTSLKALEARADFPPALDLLARIRKDAEAAAGAARQAAERAAAAGPLMNQARTREKDAQEVKAARDTQRAVDMFREAEQLYTTAMKRGEEQLKDLLARANAELRAGRFSGAAIYAVNALAIDPAHRDALALVQTLRSEAAARVRVARDRASGEGATEANSQAFRSGRAREREAEALGAPRQTADAIGFYAAAERDYSEAVTQRADQRSRVAGFVREAAEQLGGGNLQLARQAVSSALELEPENREALALRSRIELAENQQKQRDDRERLVRGLVARAESSSNVEEKRKLLTEALAADPGNSTVIGLLARLPQPGGGQQGPTPEDLAKAAIQRTLQEYEAAFAARDRETIGRIWPTGLRTYEKTLPLLSSARMTFSEVSITLTAPSVAIVKCRLDYQYVWLRAGAPPTSSAAAELTLRREGNAWVIVRP